MESGTSSPPVGFIVNPDTTVTTACNTGFTLNTGQLEWVCGTGTAPTCKEDGGKDYDKTSRNLALAEMYLSYSNVGVFNTFVLIIMVDFIEVLPWHPFS